MKWKRKENENEKKKMRRWNEEAKKLGLKGIWSEKRDRKSEERERKKNYLFKWMKKMRRENNGDREKKCRKERKKGRKQEK